MAGHWTELETAEDLAQFVLDTKANTLKRLESMVTESTIAPQYTFTVDEFNEDPNAATDGIRTTFDAPVIVRSSTLAEDGWEDSNAGRFESILDVPPEDETALNDAIEAVIDSYDGNPQNQVLVQPMIEDAARQAAETNGSYEFIEGSVTDADLVDNIMKDTDVVYHQAAQAGVRASVEEPTKVTEYNINGSQTILEAARNHDVKRVINASSSSVYGKPQYLPYDEAHPNELVSTLRGLETRGRTLHAGLQRGLRATHVAKHGNQQLRLSLYARQTPRNLRRRRTAA